MPDVLGYLHSKRMVTKQATNQNVHTACVFCDEPADQRGRLYVNVDPDMEPPGLYMCHLCGASGNLTTLKQHFGDQPNERELDSAIRCAILNMTAAYYHETLDRYPSVAAYLKGPERGLNADTVKKHSIGYAPMEITYNLTSGVRSVRRPSHLFSHLRQAGFDVGDVLATGVCQEHQGTIVDSLGGMITLPYHVAGQVVSLRGRTWPHVESDWDTWEHGRYDAPPNKYKTLAGTGTRLFNTDVSWDNREVALTEGEFDALVLEQAGFPAMGAPGAQSWQNEWDDYLTNVKRLWLVYDRDPAGERGAAKLVERFGSKVRRIFLSAQGVKCDPTTWFQTHTAHEFAELLVEAGKGGLLVSVRDAVDEFRRVQSQPGLRFGWDEIDSLLRPGLQPAQLMMLLARTGAGKTIMQLNLMHRIRMVPGQEDKRVLFLSLEQTRGEWWDRARRIHRFYYPEQTESDAIGWWEHHIRLVDRNQLSTTEVTQVLDDYAYEVGQLPDLVCLDYLGYLARGFKGEAYERTSAAVHAVKRIAKEYRIPWIVPQQVSRSARDGEEFAPDAGRDSVTGDALISLADGSRVPIADLVGQQPEVVVLDDRYRFVVRTAVKVWCKGVRPVSRVTTELGRTIKCTESHPFLTVDGWKTLSELLVGDHIAVPAELSIEGVDSFPHPELVGTLIADGCFTKSPVEFTKFQPDIREHVAELARRAGVADVHDRTGGPLSIVFSNGNHGGAPNPLTNLLRDLGCWGIKSPDRKVPLGLWTSRNDDVVAFVRGIWSCDGSITNKGLTYPSASETLARDLSALLLRLGINSRVGEERYQDGGYITGTYWKVNVRSNHDIIRFAKRIGLIGLKGIELDRVAADVGASRPNQRDSLPATVWRQIHRERRAKGLTWAEAFGRSGVDERRGLSRDRARVIAEALGDERLHDLATGSVRFAPITEIERVADEPVYDMSVAGIHNFVANEIVVKNSGALEETADFLLGMWRPEDALGRTPAERDGLIDFRILKSRHGGRGASLRMQWSPVTLVTVPHSDPLVARARRECAWHHDYPGETWEDVVLRHTPGTLR